jgi:hypothetical protein
MKDEGTMRVNLKRLLLAAVVLSWAGAAQAQTADEIVEKTLAALGGRAALAKLTSRSTTGTMTVSTPGGDVSGTIEILNEAPNKSRQLITLDLSSLGAGSLVVDQRFNGTSGYSMDSMRGNRDITGGQLDNLRNTIFPTPFLTYKERGTKIDLAGKQKVGDRDAFALTITPTSGSPSHVFIDTQTYLPVKAILTVDLPDVGSVEQTTEPSDYRDVDGVKLPFRLKGSSVVQNFTIEVTKVVHNQKVDPALFVKPSDKE